jgi:CubicO group peptidase (beta-lactamase class C family)
VHRFLTLIVILNTATVLPAQSPRKTETAQQASKGADKSSARESQLIAFEAYLEAASRHHHFTGTVLIARDEKPIFEKAYGMASLELGVPNRLNTVYNTGSLTKQFTAMAIIQLQDAGKLKTGDAICTYLPDCPAAWRPITIRHLLLHQSGIPNYSSLPDWDERLGLIRYNKGELDRLFRDLPLHFTPGQSVKYSNSGYYLLSQIIEKASGQDYDAYLRTNIFDKAGMSQTTTNQNRELLPGRAIGYYSRGPYFINATFEDPSTSTGSGGLWSTTADMYRWARAIDTGKLASAASYQEMFTPSLKEYGYGWLIRKRWGLRTTEHSGSQNGYSSFILRIPERKVTVIVLGNGDRMSAERAAIDLAAIQLGQEYKKPQASLSDTLWRKMESDGIVNAFRMLEEMRSGHSEEAKGDDDMLVEFGYELIAARKLDEADAVFQFNLRQRPASAYSLDGLADIAIVRGQKTKAISLFEQSLKIDPDNDYAKRALKRLLQS